MPKVSFILPAYKRRFLHEAIASILAQTYRDFELVVVDDCSPEDLKSVVDEFHDERLTYHRNSENIGGKDLVAAWNHAMEYAHGEWVVCAGDDDVYMPEFTEEMLNLSCEYPKVDVFHCRVAVVDSNGEIVRLSRPRAEFEDQIEMIYNSTVVRTEQKLPDFMYRRDALQRLGGYLWSPTGWYSDVMTAIALSEHNGAVYSNKFLLKWRWSGENISSRCDDVEPKIEAGVLFQKWIWKIIEEIVPNTREDEILLEEIKKGVDNDILGIIQQCWWQVPYDKAVLALKNSMLDEELKCKWILRRYHAEKGLIARLRKIRQVLMKR